MAMDLKTLGLAMMTLFSWGTASFVAKFATNRIGDKSVFWDLFGYAPAIIVYSLLAFRWKEIVSLDKAGILLSILAGAIGSFGLVGFYMLLTRKDASVAVPLTALYPALTALLAFMFLKEQLTAVKVAGISLSVIALYLLSL